MDLSRTNSSNTLSEPKTTESILSKRLNNSNQAQEIDNRKRQKLSS